MALLILLQQMPNAILSGYIVTVAVNFYRLFQVVRFIAYYYAPNKTTLLVRRKRPYVFWTIFVGIDCKELQSCTKRLDLEQKTAPR